MAWYNRIHDLLEYFIKAVLGREDATSKLNMSSHY